jgi:hypothetical protein
LSNSDAILEFLEHNRRGKYCDACIAAKTRIGPSKQVNTICNQLSKRGTLLRGDGSCTACRGSKTINVLAPAGAAPARHVRKRAATRTPTASARSARARAHQLGIEEMRTGIVRICQELCRKAKIEVAPNDGPAGIISVLKEEQLVPRHEANMMHTICNLRNVYVWEQVELGPNEQAVAAAAWKIVLAWWERARR